MLETVTSSAILDPSSNDQFSLLDVKWLISRARPTLNLPCISPQNSVTCNGEYRRPAIKAHPSFHDVEVDGGYVEYIS